MTPLADVWRKLTVSGGGIGFYTSNRKHEIPHLPGIYGWFLPLETRFGVALMMRKAQQLGLYDARLKGKAEWSSEGAGFNWEPLEVVVRKRVDAPALEDVSEREGELGASGQPLQNAFHRAAMAASIFTRPLYVGMTRNLASRYRDHVDGAPGGGDFHERFAAYAKAEGMSLPVAELLFVCVPMAEMTPEGAEQDEIRDQCRMMEQLLQSLCQPAFSAR